MTTSRAMILAAVFLGLLVGLGGYTFVYARGYSYLSNDPTACANCHVMRDHFEAWTRASHRAVAVCNDCHTPPGLLGKYATKARNGFWHSFYSRPAVIRTRCGSPFEIMMSPSVRAGSVMRSLRPPSIRRLADRQALG